MFLSRDEQQNYNNTLKINRSVDQWNGVKKQTYNM